MPLIKKNNNLLVKQISPIEMPRYSTVIDLKETVLELIRQNALQEEDLLLLTEKAVKFDNNLYNPVVVNSDYTTNLYDGIIFVHADNANVSITLDITKTKRVLVKKISGSYDVIIADKDGYLIDDKSQLVISSTNDSYTLIFADSRWFIV